MPTTKKTHNQSYESKEPMYARLHRSSTDIVIAGVAGGLGEYFSFDPVIIRIIFVLLTVFGGSGILIYIILWLMIPSDLDKKRDRSQEEIMRANADEMRTTAKEFATHHNNPVTANNARFVTAIVLIVLGVSFLSDKFSVFWFHLGRAWPILLIALGAYMLINRKRKG